MLLKLGLAPQNGLRCGSDGEDWRCGRWPLRDDAARRLQPALLSLQSATVKILVVGSGGREHALVWKLSQSPAAERIFCAPGNAGTEEIGENVDIAANNFEGLARFARENRVDLAVIGPDDPLAGGIVDFLKSHTIRAFGPNKAAARIEASKIFAKQLMGDNKVPTAAAQTFSSVTDALRACERITMPVVIKADGLALGKGVVVAHDREIAERAIRSMLEEHAFGEAGNRILIEECLVGAECSVHALVSGNSFRILSTARDHKRALDGNQGPNTGGMGAVSPSDNWGPVWETELKEKILQPLLGGLERSQINFQGLLFPGLMVTGNGLRVLEFNCRFGDPETQAILPRMQSDLLAALLVTLEGSLDTLSVEFDPRPSVTVILASAGYPGKYHTGKEITGLQDASRVRDVRIFHAGTKRMNGKVVTAGGRVLAITALGQTIEAARSTAYTAVSKIHFEGCHFRRDIALPTAK